MKLKSLSIEQKSVYLVIFNATMVLRAVGKVLKGDKKRLRNFKRTTFRELNRLISRMEDGRLKERDIVFSIERISNMYEVSFGLSQKAINVILKYHYYLNKKQIHSSMKEPLHCPLDSVILGALGINQSLTKINKRDYLDIQQKIIKKASSRISFDKRWDAQHLKEEGIL